MSDFQTSQGFDPEHDHFIVRAEVYEGMIDGLGPASDDVIDCLNELYPPCDECRDNDDE